MRGKWWNCSGWGWMPPHQGVSQSSQSFILLLQCLRNSSDKFVFREGDCLGKRRGQREKKWWIWTWLNVFFKINLNWVPRAMSESPGEWLSPGLSFSLQHFKPYFSWKVRVFPQICSHQGPCVSKATSVLLSAPSSCSSFSSAGDTAAEYSHNWRVSLLLEESQLLPAWN